MTLTAASATDHHTQPTAADRSSAPCPAWVTKHHRASKPRHHTPQPGIDGKELLAVARRSAQRWASRRQAFAPHLDVDDVASEAIAGLIAAWRSHRAVDSPRAYLDRIAANEPLRGSPTADSAARVVYRDRIAAFEQEHHRHPTRLERSDIADDIRAGWHDPRHRPSVGFERQLGEVPLDSHDWADTTAAVETVSPLIEGALDQLEDSDGSCQGKFTARREAWDTLATATGAPPARPRSMRVHHATAARKQIKAAGGAARVAADWDAGRDDATTEALFAPFGGSELDGTGRERVVELLTRHQAYAEELWAAAVRTSENRRTAPAVA
ncbi:hypothetical protein [Aeromicrobium sp. CTD01-1L150]|uniref:hypothetical protein n=1 Tax=Aeromicrobium sp. CTD01-1L150 TaxID=3341830 RepID=UPI0035C1F1C5